MLFLFAGFVLVLLYDVSVNGYGLFLLTNWVKVEVGTRACFPCHV